jgi:hypothetical protein
MLLARLWNEKFALDHPELATTAKRRPTGSVMPRSTLGIGERPGRARSTADG